MADLIEHAKRELRLAGMYDADCDYGPGKLADAVLPLIAAFSTQGHSGFSASIVIRMFRDLASFKRLSELTDDPDEWHDYGESGCLQNKRQGSCFTLDGGKTYYDIDEEKSVQNGVYGFVMHTTKHVEKAEHQAQAAQCAEPCGANPNYVSNAPDANVEKGHEAS